MERHRDVAKKAALRPQPGAAGTTPAPQHHHLRLRHGEFPGRDRLARVSPATGYTASRGYGWLAGTVEGRDRKAGGDTLRDFNQTRDATFAVDRPDGDYTVRLLMADALADHDHMAAELEGNPAGTIARLTRSMTAATMAPAAVRDGQLTVRLVDRGGLDGFTIINALSISDEAPPAVPWSVIGPWLAVAGQPSAPFAVGLNGPAPDAMRFTPSDGGAGGRFEPAYLDLSDARPSATFAYIPPGAGAPTITVAAGGGLGSSAPMTFGVRSAGALVSARDGAWSDPATWGGLAPPGPGDRAVVGHAVCRPGIACRWRWPPDPVSFCAGRSTARPRPAATSARGPAAGPPT